MGALEFVNPSDANSSAGNCSNADVCKEILRRALMSAVWTVWFYNPASSLSQKTDWFSWVWLEEWPEKQQNAWQGQWGKES